MKFESPSLCISDYFHIIYEKHRNLTIFETLCASIKFNNSAFINFISEINNFNYRNKIIISRINNFTSGINIFYCRTKIFYSIINIFIYRINISLY